MKVAITSDQRILQKRMEESENKRKEDEKNRIDTITKLIQKREELKVMKTDLRNKEQTWDQRVIQYKLDSEELQLKISRYNHEREQIELRKDQLEKLAIQIKEESKIVYNYKSAVDNARAELENMISDINAKETALHIDKQKYESEFSELAGRISAFKNTQINNKRHLDVAKSLQLQKQVDLATQKRLHEIKERSTKRDIELTSFRSFKAKDFIRDINNIGTQESYTDHSERTLLMRSKPDRIANRSINKNTRLHNSINTTEFPINSISREPSIIYYNIIEEEKNE